LTENFENFRDLVRNFGYEQSYPLESLDEEYKEGFEWANHFGYEDDIMLRPSEEWLKGIGTSRLWSRTLRAPGTRNTRSLPVTGTSTTRTTTC
jgi:hypothetical protein